ncbi:MAG: DNA-3-methyladenine glycosylase I [Anaerolineae bacterium]
MPDHDDRKHFEFLILEGAQAGLSWLTILRRREGYRRAYADWDAAAVARFTDADAARLLADPGIIRNRAKIAASIGNARAFLEVQREFGTFDGYVWRFVDGRPVQNAWRSLGELPAEDARVAGAVKTSRPAASSSSARRSCTRTCRR